VWKTGFGRLHAGPYDAPNLEWGFASSPVIHEEYVIVQCDCLNTSFVAILSLRDGSEVRRIPRHDVATWSTPLVVRNEGQTQIVCNGYREMAGYDLATGEGLWRLSGGGDIPVPSPLFARGLILLTNGHRRSPMYAVRPSARGDITPDDADPDAVGETGSKQETTTGLAWYQPRDGSYIPTPIVAGDLLYTCNDSGRLTVSRLEDGSVIYQRRVGGGANYSASAVGTEQHLYFVDETGTVRVIKTGPEFELLAENEMQEIVMATPAIAGDRLLIRTLRELICIGP
jgi:hypothetical protein